MSETEDAEAATARLEAALERIARLAPVQAASSHPVQPEPLGAQPAEEIAARLDTLIDRLRSALNGRKT